MCIISGNSKLFYDENVSKQFHLSIDCTMFVNNGESKNIFFIINFIIPWHICHTCHICWLTKVMLLRATTNCCKQHAWFVTNYSKKPQILDLPVWGEIIQMKKCKKHGTHTWCQLFFTLAVKFIWTRLW